MDAIMKDWFEKTNQRMNVTEGHYYKSQRANYINLGNVRSINPPENLLPSVSVQAPKLRSGWNR